jgi:hypothetical protein
MVNWKQRFALPAIFARRKKHHLTGLERWLVIMVVEPIHSNSLLEGRSCPVYADHFRVGNTGLSLRTLWRGPTDRHAESAEVFRTDHDRFPGKRSGFFEGRIIHAEDEPERRFGSRPSAEESKAPMN